MCFIQVVRVKARRPEVGSVSSGSRPAAQTGCKTERVGRGGEVENVAHVTVKVKITTL